MKNILFMISLLMVQAANVAKADNLKINSFTIEAGKEATASVELDNPTTQYTAFQFELIVPEGIKLKYIENDEDYAYEMNPERMSGKNWSVTITQTKDDTYQFIIYNTKNATVKETSGALFTLTFVASGTLTDGMLTGHLKNQMLAIDKDNSTDVEDTPFYINGDDTGVASIHSDSKESTFYNLSGQKKSKSQKGINIINGKKVIVK